MILLGEQCHPCRAFYNGDNKCVQYLTEGFNIFDRRAKIPNENFGLTVNFAATGHDHSWKKTQRSQINLPNVVSCQG